MNAEILADTTDGKGYLNISFDNFDDAVQFILEEEDITVTHKTVCGLVTGIYFNLEESVPVYENTEIVDYTNIEFDEDNASNKIMIKVGKDSSNYAEIVANLIIDYSEIVKVGTTAVTYDSSNVIGLDTTLTNAWVNAYSGTITLGDVDFGNEDANKIELIG